MIELIRDFITKRSSARGVLLAASALALTPDGAALFGSAAPYVALLGALLGGGITAAKKG